MNNTATKTNEVPATREQLLIETAKLSTDFIVKHLKKNIASFERNAVMIMEAMLKVLANRLETEAFVDLVSELKKIEQTIIGKKA